MVPHGVAGTVKEIKSGEFTVEETVAVITDAKGRDHEVKMLQRWPVRTPRPVVKRLPPEVPLTTGQRVVDTFFPIARGGTACVRDRSVRARRSFSTSSRSGLTPKSSSTSDAANAEMR